MAPKAPPRTAVIIDDEMAKRMDKIGKKYGLRRRSDILRQAVCKWYYEIEKMEKGNGRSRTE